MYHLALQRGGLPAPLIHVYIHIYFFAARDNRGMAMKLVVSMKSS